MSVFYMCCFYGVVMSCCYDNCANVSVRIKCGETRNPAWWHILLHCWIMLPIMLSSSPNPRYVVMMCVYVYSLHYIVYMIYTWPLKAQYFCIVKLKPLFYKFIGRIICVEKMCYSGWNLSSAISILFTVKVCWHVVFYRQQEIFWV